MDVIGADPAIRSSTMGGCLCRNSILDGAIVRA